MLDEVTKYDGNILTYVQLAHISFAVNTFVQSRGILFPVLSSQNVQQKFVDLCHTINRISSLIRESAGLDVNGIPINTPHNISPEYNNKIREFQTQRVEIVNILEAFILSNIH